jgi:plastocyanin
MRRLSSLVIAAAIASLGIASGSAGTAHAAGNACVNKNGAGMSMGGDMNDMNHGNMGRKNEKNMKMNSSRHSMGTSCPTVAGAREVPIVGDGFAFSPNEITVGAGKDITIALTAEDVGHDVYVKGIGHVVHAEAGDTEKGGIRIDEPGTYKFWCTVAGHKKAGMTGRRPPPDAGLRRDGELRGRRG